jgi:hypothetical protein
MVSARAKYCPGWVEVCAAFPTSQPTSWADDHEQIMLDYRECGFTTVTADFASFIRGLVDADEFD